ncbi:MAG TPA: glycerol-3-phosphate dehydrogenase/oxidase [Rhizomicrobium sp.]|jgi:glycerol-3-phosphate dehydrogenase|nr:glycerol-3-phosphate dehydrogenase/oxidase [Rhizomicrobium sp.]
MQRALSRLSSESFDVLIIGGGATGCFTARDCALRGLSVALVEARDFASATSAHNSKLAHGGLRYLRNLEISLVRESLGERRNLMRIAPHMVRPLPFLLPLYKAGMLERAKLQAGLSLYDLLSFDRNRLEDPAQHLPGHRWIAPKEALTREPVLAGDGFEGAFEYYDAQMYMPERIALENLIDADAHGAAIANYMAATKLLLRGGKVEGCTVEDKIAGTSFDIRARTVLVAAGPWADLFLEQATGQAAAHRLIRSKGIHLLVPEISRAALTIEAGNGHLFALPWRGHTLLATTDTEFTGDPGKVTVTEQDIADFLATFRSFLPAAGLDRERIEFFYARLRPLVSDGSPKSSERNSYNVSRRSELVDHGKEGALDGLFSALGGKWTTSRHLAEKITDALVARLGKKVPRCATATTALPGGRFDRFEDMVKGYMKTWPGIPALRNMAHMLGARLPRALKGARLTDLAALGKSGDTPAQIAFAMAEEMALTLEDMVMRRTALGQFGRPAPALVEQLASQMAAQLGWSVERKAQEIASLDPLYRTVP